MSIDVMGKAIDMSDVPLVATADLQLAMRFMVDSGKAHLMLSGLSAAELDALENAVWERLDGDIAYRRAVLIRFQCLIHVLAAQRMRALLFRQGYGLIAKAARVAAKCRLNAHRGFSSLTFVWALSGAGQSETGAYEALREAA